jgi:hypothetical protein
MAAGVLLLKFKSLELQFRELLLQLTGNFNSCEAAIPNDTAGTNTACGFLDILRLSETMEPRASSGLYWCHWTAHTNITDTETF